MIWHVVSMAANIQWSFTVTLAKCCCARVACHTAPQAKNRPTAIIHIYNYEMHTTCLRFDMSSCVNLFFRFNFSTVCTQNLQCTL